MIEFELCFDGNHYVCRINGRDVDLLKTPIGNCESHLSFTTLNKDGEIIFSSTYSDAECEEINKVYSRYKNIKVFW